MYTSERSDRTRSNKSNIFKFKTGAIAGLVGALGFGLFDKSIGITAGSQIPFTNSHFTLGGAIGNPDALNQALPTYLTSHFNNPTDGSNFSSNFHIGVAGEKVMEVIGNQNGAPGIDLNISIGDHMSHILITPELLGLAGLLTLGAVAVGVIKSRRNN